MAIDTLEQCFSIILGKRPVANVKNMRSSHSYEIIEM